MVGYIISIRMAQLTKYNNNLYSDFVVDARYFEKLPVMQLINYLFVKHRIRMYNN